MIKRMFLFVFIAITLIFSGCIQKKDDPIEGERDNVIIGMQSIPKGLDSEYTYNSREEDIICAIFDGLVEKDDNGEIKGALAKEWSISEDGLSYTFILKEDITWSDGKQIEAKHFVELFRQILSPSEDSKNISELYSIFGAEDYNKGKKPQGEVAIISTDKKTLQIRLNYRNDKLLDTLSKPRYRLRKDFEVLKSWKENYKQIVYTGAYKITDLKEKDGENTIVLKKNNNYHDKDSILTEKIILDNVANSEMGMAKFDTNQIDVFFSPPISEIDRLKSTENIIYITLQDFNSIIFNFKSPFASKIDFRKAIEEALLASLDETKVSEKFNLNLTKGEIFNDSSTKVVFSNENKDINLRYDLFSANSKIKDLVTEQNNKTLNILCVDNEKNKLLIESLKDIIEKEFNIKSTIYYYKDKDIENELTKENYDMALVEYTHIGTKESFLRSWYNTHGKEVNYNSELLDKGLIKIKGETNNLIKENLIKGMELELKKDLPLIPIANNNLFICKNNNIEGIYMDGNENIIIKNITKSTDLNEELKEKEF